ncbi:hypothetical protein RHMOL_Rhmol11G0206400 [Rhododendron molle]|uniref:Uncharacterized protein n=1 Tax=Rhododendron molle TaxID=49168 RepID=A0ACC0LV06_RHOML|nr:hypothetical protein RHMOL_Rhmol11G0206400 [Rhododendron molle]
MEILRMRHHILIHVLFKRRNHGSMVSHSHSSSRFLPSKLSLMSLVHGWNKMKCTPPTFFLQFRNDNSHGILIGSQNVGIMEVWYHILIPLQDSYHPN